MRDLVCPNCGNADPELALTVTKPNLSPQGLILMGYRCELCGATMEHVGHACGECHLQPGETCDICGRTEHAGEPADELTSGAD